MARNKSTKVPLYEKQYRQLAAAIRDCGGFHENDIADSDFPVFKHDGMHDADDMKRHVIVRYRTNFYRQNDHLGTGELIQVDLREDSSRGIHVAVFIRIKEHKKVKNNANATFKPNNSLDGEAPYCEFAGRSPRKEKVLEAILNDGRFKLEESRVILGRKIDADMIETFIRVARIAGQIDRPNGLRGLEPAKAKRAQRKVAETNVRPSKAGRPQDSKRTKKNIRKAGRDLP